uniref:VIT domain-containing protein n=1 Tax=Maylandia zebra TaxID=106582 RepID=A0A3P9DKM3_9CICH
LTLCCGKSDVDVIPLKSIEVELEVRDHVATVVSTLNYENKEDKPLEAVFVFPLPGDAAVCHFSAQIGQTQIVAEVKEKQKAREEYDDALSSGQQAFLLEESDESPDIFSLCVGSLPPGESASIRLEYVTELAVQADDGLRFCLPGVLNPRYQPQGAGVQVTSVPASLVPYSLSFSARVSSPRPISKVESNCSLDPLQYLNTDQTQATVKLAAGHKFDRDVELLIYYKNAHQPTAVVEAGQASAEPGELSDPVVMVSLYPEFPQSVMSSMASCGEFVFVVDRSGSMDCATNNTEQQESWMSSARDTLLLLLKSLPMGCYFNIYSFGSGYEHIFPKSVEYSQQTMEEALKKVEQMEANLGGTEILQPLKHIYSQPCIPNQPRQLIYTLLFVFTDGEVGNTKEVIDLVFLFGIGEGASSALINGMAKEGGGHAQFITGTDRMQPKRRSLSRRAQSWEQLRYCAGPSSSQASGRGPELTVHRLGALTLIRSMEMEARDRKGQQDGGVNEKVVQLSVQSGVSSSFTAFIAVNKVNKVNSKVIQGPLVRRNIAIVNLIQGVAVFYALGYHVEFCLSSSTIIGFCFYCILDFPAAVPEQPPRDPLLQLVSLQEASGCWLLDPALAAALGQTNEEVEKSKPEKVHCLWATILALIWLHGFKMDAKDEWELLAMKAASWLCAHNECVDAGNVLLGCSVKKEALGFS